MKAAKLLSFFLIFKIACSCNTESPDSEGEIFPKKSAKEVGLNESKVISLEQSAAQLPNLYSYLMIKDGALVSEIYSNGANASAKLHIRSITKSVSSILIGIGIDDGILENTQVKLSSVYPDYLDASRVDLLSKITLEHLLDMQSGFDWNEGIEAIPWYTTVSDSWDYIFSKSVNTEPGTLFNYNSGATSLLDRFITSNQPLSFQDYAKEHLFDPLDIQDYDWETDGLGRIRPDAGLQLRPIDLAKIGYAMIHNGAFENEKIIPSDWIRASWNFETKVVDNYASLQNIHYNNLWWMAEYNQMKVFFGLGYGGQLLLCVPQYDLIVIANHEYRLAGSVVAQHSPKFIDEIFIHVLEMLLDQ